MWIIFLIQLVYSKLQFHLIPHSHDDLGWLKTVDEYYYGNHNQIAYAGVQYILDSVVRALEEDHSRKFTYVEMGFFERWWEEQDHHMRKRLKKLIHRDQFQFVNAGWVMSDEASVYYEDIIDHMALGHAFLLEEFGIRPFVAWHIDPFGHSAANTDLFAKMGFQAMFFQRIDYQDKDKRKAERSLELLWKPYISTGFPSDLFTHVLFDGYYFPSSFCLDVRCDNSPIMDDPRLEDYNLDQRVQDFADIVFDRADHYLGNNILVPMGADFGYQDAFYDFKNMDKLNRGLEHVYKHNATFFYSTPNDYLEAIYDEKIKWPTKNDDFMPYADDPHSYWSGYYTSRPTLKGFVRSSGAYLRAAQNFFVNELLQGNIDHHDVHKAYKLFRVHRRQMGILQHHDAVTGTEKQAVAYDYAKLLNMGEQHTDFEMLYRLNELVKRRTGEADLKFDRCRLLNQTLCEFTAEFNNSTEVVELAVFNPNLNSETRIVEIPVPVDNLEVIDESNEVLAVDIIENAQKIFESENKFTLYFRAEIPALGTNLYKIRKTSARKHSRLTRLKNMEAFNSEGDNFKLTALGNTYTIHQGERNHTFTLSYNYYVSSPGDAIDAQTSGAYVFRPDANLTPNSLTYANFTDSYSYNGNVVDVMGANFDGKVVTKLVIDKNAKYFVFTTYVDSIDVSDGLGKEIIQIQQSRLPSTDTFYTDSNGMGMMKRVWNSRPTFDLNYTNEPIACNYYPINSAITFDEYALVTDRSVAGTVTPFNNTASFETLIHRRTLFDDDRGVDEAINEYDPEVKGKGLRLIYKNIVVVNNTDELQRNAEDQLQTPLQIFFARTNSTEFASGTPQVGKVDLGKQWRVRMVPVGKKTFFMRVQNRYGGGVIELDDLLKALGHSDYKVKEMGLSENQTMKEVKKHHWKWLTKDDSFLMKEESKDDRMYDFNPNEIKSYKIKIKS